MNGKGLDLDAECFSYGIAAYTALLAAVLSWAVVRRFTKGGYTR
jgi:hypothetical protein